MTPGHGRGYGYHLHVGGISLDEGSSPTSYDPGVVILPPDTATPDDPVTEIVNPGGCGNLDTYLSTGKFKWKAGPGIKKSIQQGTVGTTALTLSNDCMDGNVFQTHALFSTDELTKVSTAGQIWGTDDTWLGAGATNKITQYHDIIADTTYDLTANAGSFTDWTYVAQSMGCGWNPHTIAQNGWFFVIRVGPDIDDIFYGYNLSTTTNNVGRPQVGYASVARDLENPLHAIQAWSYDAGQSPRTADHKVSLIPDGMLNIRKHQNLMKNFWQARYGSDAWQLGGTVYEYPKWRGSNVYDLSQYGGIYMHFDATHGLQEGAGLDPVAYSLGLVEVNPITTNAYMNGVGTGFSPVVRSGTELNGYPVIDVNSSDTWNQYILPGQTAWADVIDTGPFTCCFLSYIPSGFAGNDIYFWTNAAGNGLFGIHNQRAYLDMGTGLVTGVNLVSDDTWNLTFVRRDASNNINLYVNGTDDTPGPLTNSEQFAAYRFFRSNNVLGYPYWQNSPANQPKIAMGAIWTEDLGLTGINNAAGTISDHYALGQSWSLS